MHEKKIYRNVLREMVEALVGNLCSERPWLKQYHREAKKTLN